jgi:hypothetical protein
VTDWQEALTGSCIETDRDLELEMSIGSAESRARLRVRGGRLEPAEARESEPDLEIRLHAFTPDEVLLGRVATTEVFSDAELVVGGQRSPAMPAAEPAIAMNGRFERIPGASLSVAIRVTSTIFGDVGVRERWRDGILVSSELVSLSHLEEAEVDVRVWCSLAQLAAIRRRELTPLDALAAGTGIAGGWPQLMCFAELIQHPCYDFAWSSKPSIEAQIAWGSVFCSPAYTEAVRRARSQPEPAVSL